MLTHKLVLVGAIGVNCYVVYDDTAPDCLIIDPGDEPQKIINAIQELHLKPIGILLTHAHVDHIRGVSDVSARFGLPVWCHANDRVIYSSPDNALLPWLPAAKDLPDIMDGEPPQLPTQTYEIIETPGHTPGGVCYYFRQSNVLYSGDTLFQGTYGRTDLPGGHHLSLVNSIRNKLLTLPWKTVVYPGHGGSTCIENEQGVI